MKFILKLSFIILILFPLGFLAADFQIRSTINKDNDAAVAYNSVDDEYLVVWTESSSSSSIIMGQRIKADGTGSIGAAFTIFSIGAYPSVAYNSQTNEYLVTESLLGNIIGRRVSNVGTLIGSPVTYMSKNISIWSKIIYNSLGNNYLLVAAELFDLGNDQSSIKISTRKISADGQPTGTENLIREQGHGNYSDGARFSVAYAPIISTETPTGRYLLAIQNPDDLTMLNDNGIIISRVYDSQHPGNIVGNHVPFQSSKVGISFNVDLAFGNFEGEDVFMVVWGDKDNEYNSQPWSGVWAGIVPAMPYEFNSDDGVYNTVFPVSAIASHFITKNDFKSWKPVVAYNETAYKFMVAWRETPSTDPQNDTKVNHIRANAVSSSIPNTLSNVVLSATTGDENPKNPAIAVSTKNSNALVVWDDERNFSTKDIDLYGSLFTTTPSKALILTSPNGGEEWVEGSQQQITWESAGIGASDVRIEYSIDHGASFSFITNKTNTDGVNSYNWTVPNTPSTQCIVQITANGLSDQSDATFTIKETPKITVISPNGGEIWISGTTQQIKWESVNIGDFDVTIEYSTDNDSNYQFVTFFTNVDGLNIFNWEVPNTASNQCLVRVSLSDISDISDALFTIIVPKITVVSPNGGEKWIDGEQHEIKWTSVGFSGNVRIDLLYHGTNDSGYFNIALNEINDGSFNWNLDISQLPIQSNPQGFNCLIRVSDATKNPPGIGPDDGKIFDWSDSYFTFKDNVPKITVISPNGGEVWLVGEQREIKWTSENFTDQVGIYLEAKKGPWYFWVNISTNTTNDGLFIWEIDSSDLIVPPPFLCRIRVADVSKNPPSEPEDGKVFDWSDTTFIINNNIPKITVVAPNYGDLWEVGSHQVIKWESQNFSGPVRIDYASVFNGFWFNIIHDAENTGSFIWTLQASDFIHIPDKCQIRVADATKNNPDELLEDGKIYDWSDKFTIAQEQNTFAGNNVNLNLGSGTSINFDKIDTSGITVQFIADTGSPPPGGKQIFPFNNPKHYYIETSARFSNNIQLCFSYADSGLALYDESNLKLHVYDTAQAQWVDITTSLDLVNNIICGEVSHLSEFAILMPASDPKVFIVTNTNDSGEGSFRNAIDSSNANASADKILFNIPQSDPNYDAAKGVWFIRPITYYNSILDSNLIIDGTSQRIFIGEDTNPEGPEIVFSGSSMSSNNGCLSILANNIEIYEITINNFPSTAISFSRSTNSIVSGCYFGTDYSGMISASNYHGISMEPDVFNAIIGPSPYLEKPNVISGNRQVGVFIADNSQYNIIEGNYIGVNKNGTDTITNKLRGIDLTRGANNNSIMQNIIGGNYQGIYLYESNNNLIRANKIGTNETWEYDLYNSDGILVFNNSSGNTISENIIGFNRGWGIKIAGTNSTQNAISRNLISKNLSLGIDNYDGGNLELSPPVIVSASNTEISGTAGPKQVIEIFADSANEGQVYIDSTVSDASGNFSISIQNFPDLPNITATARDIVGNTSEFSAPFIVTDIEDAENVIPTEYALYQNYPNPFNPSTILSYQLPNSGHIVLKVYDILGKEVITLVNRKQQAGKYEISFDAKDLPSGVYFYQLKTKSKTITKKMLLLE